MGTDAHERSAGRPGRRRRAVLSLGAAHVEVEQRLAPAARALHEVELGEGVDGVLERDRAGGLGAAHLATSVSKINPHNVRGSPSRDNVSKPVSAGNIQY